MPVYSVVVFKPLRRVFLFGALLLSAMTSLAAGQVSFTVTPASVAFTKSTVGIPSDGRSITVKNTGTTSLTISNFSLTPSQFQLIDGWAPITLSPGGKEVYQLKFVPDAAQTFGGQLSVTITGVADSVIVPLSGKGVSTGAVAQVTPPTLDFGVLPLGTTSAPQTSFIE